jgi:hypothetical protein
MTKVSEQRKRNYQTRDLAGECQIKGIQKQHRDSFEGAFIDIPQLAADLE